MESLGTDDKAVDILFHLHASPGLHGVTAIGRALGIPKSSAHRLLKVLDRRGLVERDSGGRYRPGVALLALGLGALEDEPIVEASRTLLEQEARALGETFFLVSARAGELVVLHKAEGTSVLRAAPRIGARVPVHATGVGKLHLAYAADRLAPPAQPLARYTPRTLAASAELEREVLETRRRGWAANRDEWILGLSGIAAPVFFAGRMVAALALSAATPRLDALGGLTLAPRVVAVARRIAMRLEGKAT